MKHLSKFFLPYILFITSAQATWHPYIGIGVGLSKSQNTFLGSMKGALTSGNVTLNMDTTGYSESIILGLRKQHENYFFAGEFFSTFHQYIVKRNSNTILGPNPLNPRQFIIVGTLDFEVYQKYTHGLSCQVGKDLMSNVDVFFKIDLFWSKFTVKYKNTNLPSNWGQESKWLFGFAPGVGLQYRLTKSLSTRLDYSYRIYNQFRTKNISQETVANDVITGKITPRIHQFTLSLLYKF